MLTAANVSSEMAVNYFIKNYYHQGKSQWSGKGAEKLGLSGAVENQQAFKNVISGRTPDGLSQLNARVLKQKERRAALDCTFSAPKSVSLMALVGGDSRLIAAHHQALEKVLTLMEQRYAITRVTQGDSRHRVNTGNLVVAEFDHIESRSLDPHLHTHCLVMNTTQAQGKWMSLVNSEIFANKKFLGMAYQSYLATEVQKLGYEVEPRNHGQFEIKGFKEQDLEAFSKRRQQIIAAAGASSCWAEREKIWDTTRQRKQKVTESELKSLWLIEAAALGINFVKPSEPNSKIQDSIDQRTLEDALAEAIAHCSERNVAFKQEDLEKFILRERLFTDVTVIEPLIKQHQELIALFGVELQYTTHKAVNRELATIELMQQGQGIVNPMSHPEVIENYLEKTTLNSGQCQAVQLAVTTSDQFIAWQGVAGAGKTFALKELKAIAKNAGYIVKGFAPSSMAAKVLSEELGIQGETVASLLVGEPPPETLTNQVWIVDEAGLLSARDAHALLLRATLVGARLLLVGDTKQLGAVEAGNPFKSLQQALIKTAHLTQSNRQRNPQLKIAVDLIADGRVEAGFRQLETIGSIQEVSADTKLEMIAADYMALSKEQRAQTLVLAGTNLEKLALTAAIRGKLKQEGSLGATANITQLQTKNLTRVQMRYTHNFELGDVVMPTRNYKRRGLEKGKLYSVVSKDLDRLILKTSAGTYLEVDTNFDKAVYQRDEIEIAVGDHLQWKKNDRQLQRRNGQEFVVTAIERDSAQIEYLDSNRTETINLKSAQNLDYALVSTIYSSQGKTTDLALIAADYTIGQESFYVAISRARHNVKLYTQDKSELLELAHSSKAKSNALELLMKQVKSAQKQSLKEQLQQLTIVGVSPKVTEPVVKQEVAIVEPVQKAQQLVIEQVSLPVLQSQTLEAVFATELQSHVEKKAVLSIFDYIEQSTVESALTQTVLELTQQLSQYKEQLQERRTAFDDLDAAIASLEQQLLSQRTVDAISEKIEQSVVDDALVETLPQLTEQLSQYRQQLQERRTAFDDLDAAIADVEQRLLSQKAVDTIANFIEQSVVDDALVETLPQLTEKLSQVRQQLQERRTAFDDLDAAIADVEQRLLSQKAVDTIANFIEQSVVDDALVETLPQLTEQLSQVRQQLQERRIAFDDLESAITTELQSHTQKRAISSIDDYIEQSTVESALTQTVLELTQQLSQYQQELLRAKTTFNDLDAVLANDLQSIIENRIISSISDYLEQSAIESALTETVLELTQQLSQYKEQLVTAQTAFNDLDAVLATEFQSHIVKKAILSISDYVEQSTVESALTETVLELTQQLSRYQQQLSADRTAFDDLGEAITDVEQQLRSQKTVDAVALNKAQTLAADKSKLKSNQTAELYKYYSTDLQNLLVTDRDTEIAIRALLDNKPAQEVEEIILASPAGWTADEAKALVIIANNQLAHSQSQPEQQLDQKQQLQSEYLAIAVPVAVELINWQLRESGSNSLRFKRATLEKQGRELVFTHDERGEIFRVAVSRNQSGELEYSPINVGLVETENIIFWQKAERILQQIIESKQQQSIRQSKGISL